MYTEDLQDKAIKRSLKKKDTCPTSPGRQAVAFEDDEDDDEDAEDDDDDDEDDDEDNDDDGLPLLLMLVLLVLVCRSRRMIMASLLTEGLQILTVRSAEAVATRGPFPLPPLPPPSPRLQQDDRIGALWPSSCRPCP